MSKNLKYIQFSKRIDKKLEGDKIKEKTTYIITQSFYFSCNTIILDEDEIDLFKQSLDKII